jgi:hypothetical protein
LILPKSIRAMLLFDGLFLQTTEAQRHRDKTDYSYSKTPGWIQVDPRFREARIPVFGPFVNEIPRLPFEYEYFCIECLYEYEKNQWYELSATISPIFDADFLRYLRELRFTLDVDAECVPCLLDSWLFSAPFMDDPIAMVRYN